MVLIDTEMLDTPVEGPIFEQGKDVEMIDTFTTRRPLKNRLWMKG